MLEEVFILLIVVLAMNLEEDNVLLWVLNQIIMWKL